MDESTKAQLQRAYALIKSGNKASALKLIDPILKTQPDNEVAWWLAANTVTNPRHVEYALEQVLRINPNHTAAQDKLTQLIFEAPVVTPQVVVQPAPIIRPAPPVVPIGSPVAIAPKNQLGLITGLLTGVVVILLIVTVVAVISVMGRDKNSESPTEIVVAANPTAFVDNTEAQIQPTRSSSEENALPATWTPVPTVPSPTPRPFVTSTPRPTDTPFAPRGPIVTIDPAQFGDTYWDGNGDGTTMELYYANGRYWRFYEFPVTVYYESEGNSPVWDYALKNAITEINQVVQMERTDDEGEADIVLKIVDPYEVAEECEVSDIFVVAGCATFRTWGGSARPNFRGFAFVSTDAVYPSSAVLHELVHALGIVVHSASRDDIMYFQETENSYLSVRDINTLRRLYNSPSFGD
jgi:hypothetical protein